MDLFSTSFWDNVYAPYFHYVEMLFAFLAALAFLIFLRGFLGSIGSIFKMNAHEEHLEHAQVREVWGVMLLVFLFLVWEVTRTVVSWIGYQGENTHLGYYIVGAGLLIWLFLFLKKEIFSGGGGH